MPVPSTYNLIATAPAAGTRPNRASWPGQFLVPRLFGATGSVCVNRLVSSTHPVSMAEDKGPDAASVKDDPRVRILIGRICQLFKMREDKAEKAFEDEASKRQTLEFLNDSATRVLYIFYGGKDDVFASTMPPALAAFKKKVVYFVDTVGDSLKAEDMAKVSVGEMTAPPLEQLLAVSQEVFFPLLVNGKNQQGWPEVMSKEVAEMFHRFLNGLFVTLGRTQGKTLLPLPPTESTSTIVKESEARDKDRIHALESSIIIWSKQIKEILKLDPESAFKDGKNPLPSQEIEFWISKSENLNAISDQLSSDRVRKAVKVLEVTKSTYFPAFSRLVKEVTQAKHEANDNCIFLRALEKHLCRISIDPFAQLLPTFNSILHTILLVWKHSRFYNSPARFVVLMRMICNDIVVQACKFLTSDLLFTGDPQDVSENLKTILRVCVSFKAIYFDYKTRASNECPSSPWRFQNPALFGRLDAYLERIHDVLDIIQTHAQFSKLEKVEVGGTKGKSLTTSVRAIYTDFLASIKTFQSAPYDIMNVDMKQFDQDFFVFRSGMNELERRLASVVIQAFDDSVSVMARFKLLDAFEGLLDREIIMSDLEKKSTDLLLAFSSDLKSVQEMFFLFNENPPVNDNLPPRSGAVTWARGLMERVDDPMMRLKSMSKGILESEEGKEVIRSHSSIMHALREYETIHIEDWAKEIENTSQEKLKQNLLVRDDSSYLRVNFDPQLVCLLREVKYFTQLGIEVPASAMQIYKNNEIFRQQTGNLDLIVNIYNKMLETLLAEERPLLASKLEAIDKALLKGLKHLNWKSASITEFIDQTKKDVKEASSILLKIKQNVLDMKAILTKWTESVLMDRKSGKTYTVEEFNQGNDALIAKRYKDIEEDGEKIYGFLASSQSTLKASKGSVAWKVYQDFVNQLAVDGICEAITASLKFFFLQVDGAYLAANDVGALLEVRMDLKDQSISYFPFLGSNAKGTGTRDLSVSWMSHMVNVSTLIKRLDSGDGDYLNDVQDDIELKTLIHSISKNILDNEALCEKYRLMYNQHEHLWCTNLEKSFKAFIQDNTPEGQKYPNLKKFEEMITKHKNIEEEVRNLPQSMSIGWLKVDARPLKAAVSHIASKWTNKFQQFLLDDLVSSVSDITSFIESQSGSLAEPVEMGNVDVFYQSMTSLKDIRSRGERGGACTQENFDAMKSIVMMLKKNGVKTPDEVLLGLEQAPQQWSDLQKAAILKRESLGAMQSDEIIKVRRKVNDFDEKWANFYVVYKNAMPSKFSENFEEAYSIIDLYHHGPASDELPLGSLVGIQKTVANLNGLQELFELNVTEYREIKQAVDQAIALKEVWDMVSLVLKLFDEWKKKKWNDIGVEVCEKLQEEAKSLSKDVKNMSRGAKIWSAHKGVEDTVKNMQTTLPLITDLKNPAMRERHWKQLARATGVSFSMDERFTFGDLMALKLHNFVDDVGEIVDRASKELNIEKQLKKIADAWIPLVIEFVLWQEGNDLQLLQVPENVVEALEENVVLLQNLQASKYVQGNAAFLEEVTKWQRKLGNVDSCLTSWREVQTKWSNLQSIFVGSADIRVQLPEDSKRFDGIDAEFKELQREAMMTPNVIEACNFEGRIDRIEAMLGLLEQCEKALADYLETKRIAYPRFYFVSSADLIDILSKGSNPHSIMKHMPKCFDNVATFEFSVDKDGNKTKDAIGMYSKEREYVPFHESFKMEGAVENYLREITHHTHVVIVRVMADAVAVAEDKPRHQFMYDWPAQITCSALRIIYTEEVHIAFEQQEEGNETAMKDYNKKQQEQLAKCADLILTDLTPNNRLLTISVVTVDVHSRDVVAQIIEGKVENAQNFMWQSQLKFSMDQKTQRLQMNICDYQNFYGNEYIGNAGCLVITPLTDRCYITLTQAMRLVLGGAPAGPAGTGKTETVKDLGRASGIIVYVFNCSDQMDYKSMGQVFKGLSMSGAWGCFDEFNRINLEVLSVVSSQWKTVLDAIRVKRPRFVFEDEEISLSIDPLCCAFITMNPGYGGRVELPTSLKVLFRPCAMVVPDMDLIAEIMLMSEGFVDGKVLARKFMILYRLSQDLLSQAKHYDWKLRAIKTTLNVAGSMRRSDILMTEDKVLLRALRDFNLGKLVSDDVGIFTGLLNDLFPKTMELVPRKIDKKFEDLIIQASKELLLQPEDIFVLKVTQLQEILGVRWSIFVIGPAGSGKSELIKTLQRSNILNGQKHTINNLNPKAVTRNELYGYINQATREWKDGLISQIFRDLANCTTIPHEHIVIDGDVDPEWIESMNTVMDDNKMLTLASNERIPLTKPMRLVLEVENLREASPATVSRNGIIFVNDTDIGWRPFVKSWIQGREIESEKSQLTKYFEAYVPKTMDWMKKNVKTIAPLPQLNLAQTVCYIMDGLLGSGEKMATTQKSMSPDEASILFEAVFVYACIWGLGGALTTDKSNDHRGSFDKFWRDEHKTIRLPDVGLVFDYAVDLDTGAYLPWASQVPNYTYVADVPFGNISVSTVDTVRLTFFLTLLMDLKRCVMFVGGSGTGKTTIVKDKLRSLDPDQYLFLSMNLNCYTDSLSLQTSMESMVEKKTGKLFGPPGSKKLIYFIDDLNMPQVDKYGTQQPIALLRQHMDYGEWYERTKLTLKQIQGVQYVSCLNPSAGSFVIDPRCQRQYCTFAVTAPSLDQVTHIFTSIFSGHLSVFNPDISANCSRIVKAAVDLHRMVTDVFVPTAIKFHYIFNLRELSSVFEGLCRSREMFYSTNLSVVRLFIHEAERVYQDRMITEADRTRYWEIVSDIVKKNFDNLSKDQVEARPLIFTSFTTQSSDDSRPYMPATDFAKLRKTVEDKLAEYNETNAVMDLVLFEQAIEHVCRITRVIDKPRGNALCVGVGGSGKTSLTKLSAFICGYESYQVTVTASYNVNAFKENLAELYIKTTVKNIATCFIFNDGQIIDERFLVYMNDLLASGNISDLLIKEQKDDCMNSVRNEAKQAGVMDSPEALWEFFIEKSRKMWHTVLCFSPVGDKFRIRARQFPALTSCTVIDWFHPWPHDALIAVANRFVADIPDLDDKLKESLALHMAYVHTSVGDASTAFLEAERRFNYTTPKSFLDLIDLYKTMLAKKRQGVLQLKERLENGLEKMRSAADQVAMLQENLKVEVAVVEEKKAATDALIVNVGQETAIAEVQQKAAAEEEAKVSVLAAECMEIQKECEIDLLAAEPIIKAALAALDSLDKKSLGEMKSLATPPPEVADVAAAVMILTAPKGAIPKDLSWGASKKMMNAVDKFLSLLQTFDRDNIPEICVATLEKTYLAMPGFTAENIKTKSGAAAGLCAWVINIAKYFRIFQYVEPKRQKLADANAKKAGADESLSHVRTAVAKLEARLAELARLYEEASSDKAKAVAQMQKTMSRADMAARLINGLADEKVRWEQTVQLFDKQLLNLTGDSLVSSAFVSYVGSFNVKFRNMLVNDKWVPDLQERRIPMTDGVHPLDILCNASDIAKWNNEGLPSDTLSIQNGAIIANCKRWALMIDPQLQGIKWIRNRHRQLIYPEIKNPDDDEDGPAKKVQYDMTADPVVREMRIVQLSQDKYVNFIELAISNGEAIMIENLKESIDAVMEPVLVRALIKRGRGFVIKLGDKEVEYDPNFRLYLQTKLSNPHYKPEIAAQTTLINFMITADGMEEQLLALVVNKERPDLEKQKQALLQQQNEFLVRLKDLEDDLLYKLANSQGDILADVSLIEGLEFTKKTAAEINEKSKMAVETSKIISLTREAYRPVAIRGSLMYFLIDSLNILDWMYQFSMANFVTILKKGMDLCDAVADANEDDDEDGRRRGGNDDDDDAKPAKGEKSELKIRIDKLTEVACYTIFAYVRQALFEEHKIIFATQLCMRILAQRGQLDSVLFNFLMRGPRDMSHDNPEATREWLSDTNWGAIQSLKQIEGFESLADEIVASAKRFREWCENERPEDAPMPGEWKKIPEFNKLLIIRCLRPDRMPEALTSFVRTVLGKQYVQTLGFDLEKAYDDSRPDVPMFFILSPGTDPVKAVEAFGRKNDITLESGKFALVSLGQGQEPTAQKALENAHKNGGYVFLQNIHLTVKWTSGWLEKKIDKLASGAHPDFRLFLSAEPSADRINGTIPISLLQSCIKLTNEPPEGLSENLRVAYAPFENDFFENCSKGGELRSIVFSLCFFHAVIVQRKKFGPQGWNGKYPFNEGDLRSSAQVASNYLEANPKVPWDDLRYIFGEIMYGGHVTDDWDRKLVKAYLETYMGEELLEGIEIFPGFMTPGNSLITKQVIQYVETSMPGETPVAFGLHPNAEIGFRLQKADSLFKNIQELQPRSAGSGGGGMSLGDVAKAKLDEILEKLPDGIDYNEIIERLTADGGERTPYTSVFLQEIERMNMLLKGMKLSLLELDLGLKGDLQISDAMLGLMNALFEDRVYINWANLAYPSARGLTTWFLNLLERVKQLQDWSADLQLPKCTSIPSLFNPQSFITAVMQTTARANSWPLDRLVIATEVTRFTKEAMQASKSGVSEGAAVIGFLLEGARWDEKAGNLDDSKPKELFQELPVVIIKSITVDKAETKDVYLCPCYKTQVRGPNYVFTAVLKTKAPARKWIIGGVALILDIVPI